MYSSRDSPQHRHSLTKRIEKVSRKLNHDHPKVRKYALLKIIFELSRNPGKMRPIIKAGGLVQSVDKLFFLREDHLDKVDFETILTNIRPLVQQNTRLCNYHSFRDKESQASHTTSYVSVEVFKKYGNGSGIPDPKSNLIWIEKSSFAESELNQRWKNDKRWVKQVQLLAELLNDLENNQSKKLAIRKGLPLLKGGQHTRKFSPRKKMNKKDKLSPRKKQIKLPKVSWRSSRRSSTNIISKNLSTFTKESKRSSSAGTVFDLFKLNSPQSLDNALIFMKAQDPQYTDPLRHSNWIPINAETVLSHEKLFQNGFRRRGKLIESSPSSRATKLRKNRRRENPNEGDIVDSIFYRQGKRTLGHSHHLIIADIGTYSRILDAELNKSRKGFNKKKGWLQRRKRIRRRKVNPLEKYMTPTFFKKQGLVGVENTVNMIKTPTLILRS